MAVILETVALYLLLIVIGARPLVSETFDSGIDPFGLALGLPSGPGPVLPLTMSLLVLAAAVLAAIGWAKGPGRADNRRSAGILFGAMLLALGMLNSLSAASGKRIALNASSDWLTAIIVCGVLVRLLRRPWQIRLLLSVLVATAVTFAAQCALQRFLEYPETIAEYQKNRETFWAQQGVPLDDARVLLYEKRLEARDAGGFFAHANVAGSFLLLSTWVAAALAAAKLRGPASPFRLVFAAVTGILAVLLFASIVMTGSRGALLAGALTAGLAVGWVLVSPRFRDRWAARWAAGWALAMIVGAAVVVGAKHSSPWSSLGFRWNYWRTTEPLLRDFFWTGVGAQNFGKVYLRYKPIAVAEEIQDPHNWLLSAFCQWGVIGLAGLVALAVGVSLHWTMTAPARPDPPPEARPPAADRFSPWPWLLSLAAGVLAVRVWSLWGNSTDYVRYAAGVPLLIWCLSFVAAMLESDRLAWSDLPIAPAAGFLLFAGALAFLLHGMIDVSVFYPATATVLFAVLAAALAVRYQNAAPAEGPTDRPAAVRPAVVMAAAFAVLFVAHAVWLWRPAACVQWNVEEARRLARQESATASPRGMIDPVRSAAMAAYREAIAADPLDATAPREAAEWLLRELHRIEAPAGEPSIFCSAPTDAPAAAFVVWPAKMIEEIVRLLQVAEQRDPLEIGIQRTKATAHSFRAKACRGLADAHAAIGAARGAVSRYPQSPQDHLLLAEMLSLLADLLPPQGFEIAEVRRMAAAECRLALDLDAARPGTVELRRWSPERRQQLEDAFCQDPEAAATQTAPTSGPAPASEPSPASEPAAASQPSGRSSGFPPLGRAAAVARDQYASLLVRMPLP